MHSANQSEVYKTITIAVAVLSFAIAYFLYSIIRQRNIFITWQKARIRAEITTIENERKRIAGDLHDDIGPMLSAIKLQVNHVEPANEEERIIIEKSGKYIDEVIQRFRDIAYDLLPNTLIRNGLIKAVVEFIGKINEACPLPIVFTHDEAIELTPEKELNLYRIVQEIIHNTIKHASASQLTIHLYKENQQLVFSAVDNGKGFTYNESNPPPAAGLGLLNIQNRVALLNGRLTLKSEPQKGTSYRIIIPLE